MRILLADDDPVIHTIINAVLSPEGHEIISAMDGEQALDLFTHHRPDLVLTDFRMPRMDGLTLCRAITNKKGNALVPIVLFTGAGYPAFLREALASGAIECITKPFEAGELRMRVQSLQKMVQLHQALSQEKSKSDEEILVVKQTLNRLLQSSYSVMPPHCDMETLPTARIGGDACVYGSGIPGVHYGMICDATGHGLMAGVSTLPVIETFLGMVKKDLGLANIFQEIQSKLQLLLPTGRFVCLLLSRLDTNVGTLSVLNAGIPEAMLHRNGETLHRFSSKNLPAGISGGGEFPLDVDQVEVKAGDRFFAFSDGLVEAFTLENLQQRLLEAFTPLAHANHCEHIRQALMARVGSHADQYDDISWALWEVPPFMIQKTQAVAIASLDEENLEAGMTASFLLHPGYLDPKDILPQLQTFLKGQNVAEENSQILMLLLTEAITNAVDHGVLELASSIKASEGFDAFEALRQERLAVCQEGHVEVTLRLLFQPSTHQIKKVQVCVIDSGKGFDWRALETSPINTVLPFGRGLALMRALSTELKFNEQGNQVSFSMLCA